MKLIGMKMVEMMVSTFIITSVDPLDGVIIAAPEEDPRLRPYQMGLLPLPLDHESVRRAAPSARDRPEGADFEQPGASAPGGEAQGYFKP
jgi:hypothetical protein